MAKRIKKVFGSSDQVLHLWANQSQDSARSSNVFFEGDTVYSYGRHYKLGQIVKYKGKTVALINTTGYSVTTAKHIRSAQQATSHLLQVDVSRDFDIEKAMKLQKSEIQCRLLAHFKRLKVGKGESWSNEYSDRMLVEDHNKLCESLKLSKYKVKVTPKYIKEYNAHIQARLKREQELNSPEMIAKRDAKKIARDEARKQVAEIERAARLVKDQHEIEAWKYSGGQLTYAVRNIYPNIIRVKGDIVQTSGGAEVSLTEARALLSKIVRSEAKYGDVIGSFTFNRVEDNIVTIGCHNLDLEQAKTVLNPLRIVKEA